MALTPSEVTWFKQASEARSARADNEFERGMYSFLAVMCDVILDEMREGRVGPDGVNDSSRSEAAETPAPYPIPVVVGAD